MFSMSKNKTIKGTNKNVNVRCGSSKSNPNSVQENIFRDTDLVAIPYKSIFRGFIPSNTNFKIIKLITSKTKKRDSYKTNKLWRKT